jgi:hypothetical protein
VIIGSPFLPRLPVFRRKFQKIVLNFPAVMAALLMEHDHDFFSVSVSGVFYEQSSGQIPFF